MTVFLGCLGPTGQLLWEHVLSAVKPFSPTVGTNGKLMAVFNNAVFATYDLSGIPDASLDLSQQRSLQANGTELEEALAGCEQGILDLELGEAASVVPLGTPAVSGSKAWVMAQTPTVTASANQLGKLFLIETEGSISKRLSVKWETTLQLNSNADTLASAVAGNSFVFAGRKVGCQPAGNYISGITDGGNLATQLFTMPTPGSAEVVQIMVDPRDGSSSVWAVFNNSCTLLRINATTGLTLTKLDVCTLLGEVSIQSKIVVARAKLQAAEHVALVFSVFDSATASSVLACIDVESSTILWKVGLSEPFYGQISIVGAEQLGRASNNSNLIVVSTESNVFAFGA
mmetsp:Transcript_7834/g.14955  ORF Transcript_7834/g.14955 Transcript_7834/m.14955 type:complete len:344 (+) Transcript_7834:518-1549(+)